MNRGMGRPSIYTPELASAICERLAAGESLRAICRDAAMPARSVVHGWVVDDVNGFAAQYARSRDLGLDEMADELMDVADDGRNDWIERESKRTGETYTMVNEEAIGRSRLRVDARKWYLSKMAPKRYGESSKVELTGANGGPVQFSDTERAAKLSAMLALAAQRREQDASDLT